MDHYTINISNNSVLSQKLMNELEMHYVAIFKL